MLGLKLQDLEELYLIMDEDFNNSFPYIGTDGRIELCSTEEAAEALKAYLHKNYMGHVSIKKIPGKEIPEELTRLSDLGIAILRLDNGVEPVEIWFRDFLDRETTSLLEKENSAIAQMLLRDLQYACRANKLEDPDPAGKKNLLEHMLTMRYNAFSRLGNTAVYALAEVPEGQGITWYTPRALELAKKRLAKQNLPESALLAPGDRQYRVYEWKANLRVTQLPGQTAAESLVCIFTGRAPAEQTRKRFAEYGAVDGILVISFEELYGHAMQCAGLIVDLPSYGYVLKKEDLQEVQEKALLDGVILVNGTQNPESDKKE